MGQRWGRRAAGALVVVLALGSAAGCGDDGGAATTAPEGTAAATAPAEPTPSAPTTTASPPPAPAPSSAPAQPAPAAVPEALDFRATALDGSTFDGATLAGTPTVLWFWAPWCAVCARGGPAVADAAAELDGRVRVVGVGGLSGSTGDMQDFVERTGTGELTQLADVEGDLYARFGVAQQSTFAFVAADGTVELLDGYASEPDLVAEATERFDL